MNKTQQYQALVRLAFPKPSPAMQNYIRGFGSENLDERQRAWEALSESERQRCRDIQQSLS